MYVYTLNKYSHANNMNTYKVENIQVITTSPKEKQFIQRQVLWSFSVESMASLEA